MFIDLGLNTDHYSYSLDNQLSLRILTVMWILKMLHGTVSNLYKMIRNYITNA